jgi:hypothetical protein
MIENINHIIALNVFFVSQFQYIQLCALELYLSRNQLKYLTGDVDQIQIAEFS